MRPTARRHECCTAKRPRWQAILSALLAAAVLSAAGWTAAAHAQCTVPAIEIREG